MSIDETEQVDERGGLFEHQLVAAPGDDTMQWRAALLQMVNWGGFAGLTTVPLGGDATMISGASGVGKSTILDAYTALMMPSDTKFNGASNDAVSGRARGVGQRNLLSYLRGAVDVVDDPRTGRPVEKLLRGRGVDTWGAVAMTFVNDRGGSFTALRTYYVPRRATRSSEVQMQLVSHEGPLDLASLEVAVAERFHANTLKKLYPGVRVHRTYAEYAEVLHARLGIGGGGDGAKALRLLSRIQAGNQVRSVDELFKDMVLERPSTYAAADRAIEHFDDLDAAHAAMRTEEEKLALLEPIAGLHERRAAAARRLAELDSYGVTAPGDTPLRLWLLRTHRRLIEAAVETNRDERAATSEALAGARSAEAALVADLEAAKDAHRDAGGGDLQALAAQVDHERAIREERAARLAELEERVYPLVGLVDDAAETAPDLDSALDSAAGFAALQLHARKQLAAGDDARARLRAERDEVRDALVPLKEQQAALRRERASLESRAGRVPSHLHELRSEVARAAGMSPEELPYVAELLDVAPEEARWRTAIETVLGGTARTMLVPVERLAHFSAAIDGLRLRTRFTFQGVDLDLPDTGPSDPERIAGKLLFKDSPFSGWVQQHVAEASRNAFCVETAAGLDGPGFRVTEAGQTRNGRRGAHGRGEQRSIIGFSNEEAVAEVDLLKRLAGHPGDGGVDPHHLLDAGRAQVGSPGEQPPLVGVAQQGAHRQRQLVAGGLHAGEDQEDQRDRELVVAQAGLALGRRVGRAHQRGQEVVARGGPPVRDHVGEVAAEAVEGGLDAGHLRGHVGGEGGAEVVGPVRDLRPVVLVQPEEAADHPGGVRLGQLADELDAPPAGEAVDQLLGQGGERGPHRLDRALAEGRQQQPAHPVVVLALEAQQRLAPPVVEEPRVDAVLGRPPRVALHEAAVAQQRGALLVAQHRCAVRRARPPRALARGVHLLAVGVEAGVGQVEPGDLVGGAGAHRRTIRRCRPCASPSSTAPSSAKPCRS